MPKVIWINNLKKYFITKDFLMTAYDYYKIQWGKFSSVIYEIS